MSAAESSDSGEEVARVSITEPQIIAVKTPSVRHWTNSVPLWGIFGALVFCAAAWATLAADVRNLQSSVDRASAADSKRDEKRDASYQQRFQFLEEGHQEYLRWRAVLEAGGGKRR